MNNFLVVGLPRSRTAWLSVFLSQSGAHCYHDGFNGCESINDYIIKISNCNDSNTGLMILDVNKLFPNRKVLIIEKSKDELKRCIDWCDSNYGGSSESTILNLKEKMGKIKGLRIKQSEINQHLEKIWVFLTGEKYLERYGNMVNLNIQSNHLDVNQVEAKRFIESI